MLRDVAGSVRLDNTAEDSEDLSVLPNGATDQKVGGSTPSERAEQVQVRAGHRSYAPVQQAMIVRAMFCATSGRRRVGVKFAGMACTSTSRTL